MILIDLWKFWNFEDAKRFPEKEKSLAEFLFKTKKQQNYKNSPTYQFEDDDGLKKESTGDTATYCWYQDGFHRWICML